MRFRAGHGKGRGAVGLGSAGWGEARLDMARIRRGGSFVPSLSLTVQENPPDEG